MSEMRARGFLTDREREFLQTGDDGGSNPRKLRQQIRERLRGCLADMAILYEHLEPRDIEQLCDVSNETFEGEFGDNYHRAIGLYYRLAAESGAAPERILWQALQSAHREGNQSAVTNVELRLRAASRRNIKQTAEGKLERWEELTDMEMRAIFENPLLMEENFFEILHRHRTNHYESLKRIISDNPELIEEGLRIVEETLPGVEDRRHPDILARDAEDRLVLIDVWGKDIRNIDYQRQAERFLDMVEDFGGEMQVRALVVTLDEDTPQFLQESPLEMVSLYEDLSPIETIYPI